MLVQAIAQVEQAILQTQKNLNRIQSKYNQELCYSVPPLAILDQISSLEHRITELERTKEHIQQQKIELAQQLSIRMQENRTLLEEILKATPYDGDYEAVDSFIDVAQSLIDS